MCQPYLDDNLVHSSSFKEHVDHMREVLNQKHGVKITPVSVKSSNEKYVSFVEWFQRTAIPWTLLKSHQSRP